MCLWTVTIMEISRLLWYWYCCCCYRSIAWWIQGSRMLMPRDDITGTSAWGKQEIYRQSSNITQSTQKCLMKQLCSKYSYVRTTRYLSTFCLKVLVTWKTGEILHMSMRPEPRYCPVERKKVRRGIPKQRDSSRNWTKLCLWWRGSVVEFASCDQNSIICAGDKLIVE